jgi:hypothetical protein
VLLNLDWQILGIFVSRIQEDGRTGNAEYLSLSFLNPGSAQCELDTIGAKTESENLTETSEIKK